MTDRQLADKMVEALEDFSKNYDCDTAEGGRHDPARCRCCKAEAALAAFREAGKGKCRACKGRGWMPIPEGSAVCGKCEGKGEA